MFEPEVAYLPEDDADVVSSRRATPRRRRRVIATSLAAVALLGLGGVSGAWAGASSFSDVPNDHPFHDEIIWASTHDITAGFKDGTFHPSDAVSRQAAVAYLERYNAAITTHTVNIPQTGSDSFSGMAHCPTGKVPIAGGGRIDSSNIFMTDSYPTNDGWYTRWETDNNTNVDSGGTVWVTCKPDDSPS
jgi:hypothetical protein